MNKVKKIFLILGLSLTATWAQATLVTQTFDYASQPGGGYVIPDGNPVGAVFTENFTAAQLGALIGGITVNLTVSGGYNGDLYAYLIAPNGTMVVLMNQPGTDDFGSPAAGFNNITLVGYTEAVNNSYSSIQGADGTYNTQLTGTYSAMGNLDAFGTMSNPGGSANGTWTLYFEDLSSGGGTSILNGWTLNATLVPEPVETALMIFVTLLLATGIYKRLRQRRELKLTSAAKQSA